MIEKIHVEGIDINTKGINLLVEPSSQDDRFQLKKGEYRLSEVVEELESIPEKDQ